MKKETARKKFSTNFALKLVAQGNTYFVALASERERKSWWNALDSCLLK